jgi:hypothetical protein
MESRIRSLITGIMRPQKNHDAGYDKTRPQSSSDISSPVTGRNQDHPQLPELQEPPHPPPPMGLAEVMPNPDLGPASTNSMLTEPQVSRRPFSIKNLTSSFSKISSSFFGSSKANPREGPEQPPCIRATRRAESILFCSMYSFSFDTAKSVTVKSDIGTSF